MGIAYSHIFIAIVAAVIEDIVEMNMKRRHYSQQMSTMSTRSGHSEKSGHGRKPLTRAVSIKKPKDDKERLLEELKVISAES